MQEVKHPPESALCVHTGPGPDQQLTRILCDFASSRLTIHQALQQLHSAMKLPTIVHFVAAADHRRLSTAAAKDAAP